MFTAAVLLALCGATPDDYSTLIGEIVAPISIPYHLGEIPHYDVVLTRPASTLPRADSDYGKLKPFATRARVLARDCRIAGLIRAHGLLDASRDKEVAGHPLVQEALRDLRNIERFNRSFERGRDDPLARGFELVNDQLQGSEQGFRDFHGIPGDPLSALDYLPHIIAPVIAEAIKANMPSPEEMISTETASRIDWNGDEERRQLTDKLFKQVSAALTTKPCISLPLQSFVHYRPQHGAVALEVRNASSQMLTDVLLRIHSKLALTRRGMAFTAFIPEWAPGQSVTVSRLTILKLRFRERRVRRPAVVNPCGLIATVHSAQGYSLPQEILLQAHWDEGRTTSELGTQRLPMATRSLADSRQWVTRGPDRFVTAEVVSQTRTNITVRPQDGELETIPLRLVDSQDRKRLREGHAEGMRTWTIKTEETFEGALAGFPGREGVTVETTSGETRRIDKTDLSPRDRAYVMKLTRLQ